MHFKGSLILYCYTAPVVQQNALGNACLKFPFGISGSGQMWGSSQSYLQSAYGTAESKYCFVPAVSEYPPAEPNISELVYAKYCRMKRCASHASPTFTGCLPGEILLPAQGLQAAPVRAGVGT